MSESGEKRTASISVRIGPNLKRRLERDAKQEKAKSTSEFLHTLIAEAIAARDARGTTGEGKPPADPATGEKLDRMLQALEEFGTLLRGFGEADPDAKESLGKIRKGVRALDETLKAELLQLRGDAAEKLGRANTELTALRRNLADMFALMLVKVDPKVKPEDAKQWVLENFFGKKG